MAPPWSAVGGGIGVFEDARTSVGGPALRRHKRQRSFEKTPGEVGETWGKNQMKDLIGAYILQ